MGSLIYLFFVPKKDQCDLCVSFDNSKNDATVTKNLTGKYNRHLKEKVLSRTEKDKNDIDENIIITCYDLQAALTTPRG